MQILIDGFNLIYKFPELIEFMYSQKLDKGILGIIHILNEYIQAAARKEIPSELRLTGEYHLMIDGKKQPGINIEQEKVKYLQVYYTHELSADHFIKQFVRQSPYPRNICVITSDKAILQYTKRFGVKQISSEKFQEMVSQALSFDPSRPSPPGEEADLRLSKDEVSYWEKIFKDGNTTDNNV